MGNETHMKFHLLGDIVSRTVIFQTFRIILKSHPSRFISTADCTYLRLFHLHEEWKRAVRADHPSAAAKFHSTNRKMEQQRSIGFTIYGTPRDSFPPVSVSLLNHGR
ncbi:hypothetical protein AVEN_214674-1 [Araneus ventricosus]|uniref:Uncharacterized protein n=1 Tax=Araneus ventricosus TaxID=182803 RepID=A0A4Y2KBG6_ARAVE|nr:hypothetical protein AVEN_214674-1 [Araneus ventricosus]